MIDVRELTKLYDDFTAVDRLSFSVRPSEIVGLIGPNGAGKTTTLRCIVGIHAPTRGSIAVGGHDTVKNPVECKRLLAFMADEPQLFDYLTVMEHLRLVARLYQVREFDERAKALIQELQLTGKENSLPAELSRGMKQKVAIACGLIREPQVLIFDEPLTGLDPLGIRHMKETIVRRGRAGAAVIVSSHLLHLVEEICTRIVIIDRGVKVADGTLDELRARPELATAGSNLESIFITATTRDDAKAPASTDTQ